MTCRRFWMSATCGSVLLTAAAQSAVGADSPKDVKLFILAGQSNMEGLGQNQHLPRPYDKPQQDVQMWFDNAKGFTPLSGGFGHVREWFGPEVTLGRTLKDALPGQEVVLVKAAFSGANLARDWNPSLNGAYATLKAKVAQARKTLAAQGKNVWIAGMFWVQGESDSRDKQMAQAYRPNLESFIGIVRRDFQSPQMPFVFARVHARLGLPEASVYDHGGFDFVPVIREAQKAVADGVFGTRMVDTDDLALRLKPPNYDNLVHYDTQGVLELGRRMAKAFLALPKNDARPPAKILSRLDSLPGVQDGAGQSGHR